MHLRLGRRRTSAPANTRKGLTRSIQRRSRIRGRNVFHGGLEFDSKPDFLGSGTYDPLTKDAHEVQ
jgi:hypothetical protein